MCMYNHVWYTQSSRGSVVCVLPSVVITVHPSVLSCLSHSSEATLVSVTDNLSADCPAGLTPVLSRVASHLTGSTLSPLLLPPLLCGLRCRRAQSSTCPLSFCDLAQTLNAICMQLTQIFISRADFS